jgi:uncharacterized protein
MKNRLLLIAGVTAVCGLIAASFLYFSSPGEPPVSHVVQAPAIDVAALKAKAEQGDVESQSRLGKAFADGDGVKRDFKQAARWYGLAASNGNAEAAAMMGELCQAGQGVPLDLTNAVRWFSKAANQGSTAAQFDLGFMYEQGRGVPHDEKLAAQWYRLASEGGDITAQFDYGQRCVLGLGVAKDPVEGLKWLLLSAAQGQPDARAKAEFVQKDVSRDQVKEAKHRAAAFTPRAESR